MKVKGIARVGVRLPINYTPSLRTVSQVVPETGRVRPLGVIIIAIFLIFSAILSLAFVPYDPFNLVFMVLDIVAAIGLLALKEWGRKLTLFVIWLAFIYSFLQIIGMGSFIARSGLAPEMVGVMIGSLAAPLLIRIFLVVVVTWYLMRSGVKMAFKPKSAYVSPPTMAQPVMPSQPGPPSAIRYCPYCGTEVKPEHIFCPNCGKKVREATPQPATSLNKCPSCGLEVQPSDVFCPNCGKRLKEVG